MADMPSVGKLGAIIAPDTKGFKAKLKAALKAASGVAKLKVKLELDDKDMMKAFTGLEIIAATNPIELRVELDKKSFLMQLKELEALAKVNPVRIPVSPSSTPRNSDGAQGTGLPNNAQPIKVPIKADLNQDHLRDMEQRVKSVLKDVKVEVPLDTRQSQIKLDNFSRRANEIFKELNKPLPETATGRIGRHKELDAMVKDFEDNEYTVSVKAKAETAKAEAELARVSRNRDVKLDVKGNWRNITGIASALNSLTLKPAAAIGKWSLGIASLGSMAAVAVVGITTFAGSLKQLAGVAGLVPAAFGTMIAMTGTLLAAFSGVGTAYKAMVENAKRGGGVVKNEEVRALQMIDANDTVAKAKEDLARITVSGNKQIVEAEKTLADAKRNIGLTAARSLKDVQDAQERLDKSNRTAASAQKKLTDSRIEAAKVLKDLTSELRDANLATREAEFDVQKAMEAYQRSTTDGSGLNTQNELLLIWDQAKEKLSDNKDATQELTKKQADAAKKGVTNADIVVEAQQALTDALKDQADAGRDLKIAEEQRLESARDATERLGDAERALSDARLQDFQNRKDALRQIEKSERALLIMELQRTDTGSRAEDAMAALTDEGRALVFALLDSKEALKSVGEIAQKNLLGPIAKPLESMVKTLLPQLKDGVANLASSMGGQFAELFGSIEKTLKGGDLKTQLDNMATGADKFKGAIAPLMQILSDFGVVGTSFFPQIAESIATATQKFSDFISKAREDGSLKNWIQGGLDGLKSLGELIYGVGAFFASINDSARKAGLGSTIQTWADALNGAAKIMEQEPFKSAMVKIFEGIKGAMDGIGKAWGPIGAMLVENAPLISSLLSTLGNTVGTVLGQIATAVSGGQFQAGALGFVDGLQKALTGIDWNTIGALIGMVLGFLGDLMPMITPIINQLAESLVPILKDLFYQLGPVLQAAVEALVPIIDFVGKGIQGLLFILRPLLDILKGVCDFLAGVFTGNWEKAWSGIVEILKGFMDLIVIIVGGIVGGLLKAVGQIFEGIHKKVYESGDGLRSLIGDIGKNISNAWNGFWENFGSQTRTGWETIMDFFRKMPENIANFFKDAGKWLLGSGKSLILGLLTGIKQAAPFLGGVIDKMMNDVSGFFPHSPAKKGAFSGRGYTTFSGAALTRDFAKGILGETDSVTAATDALMRAVSMPTSANLAINATTSNRAITSAATRAELVPQRPIDIHLTSPTPGAAALEIQRTLERSGI